MAGTFIAAAVVLTIKDMRNDKAEARKVMEEIEEDDKAKNKAQRKASSDFEKQVGRVLDGLAPDSDAGECGEKT